jgi:hypothetical protein
MTEIALRGSLRQRQHRTLTMAGAAVAAAAAAAAIIFGGPILYNDEERDRGLPAKEKSASEREVGARAPRDGEVAATIQLPALDATGAFAAFDHVYIRSHQAPAGALVKVDPNTNEVVADIPFPSNIDLRDRVPPVAGAGSIWYPGEAEVVRFDPDLELIATIRAPAPLVASDGKRVWTATGDGRVAEIDTRTNRLGRAVNLGGPLSSFAYAGGRLWTAGPGGTFEIEPDSLRVIEGVALESAPASMVAVGDEVWISLPYPDQLARLAPGDHDPRIVQLPKGRDEFDPLLASSSDGKTVLAMMNGNEMVGVDVATERVVDHVATTDSGYLVEVAVVGDTVWIPSRIRPELLRFEWQRPSS